jgi:hypothetical protein
VLLIVVARACACPAVRHTIVDVSESVDVTAAPSGSGIEITVSAGKTAPSKAGVVRVKR